MTAEIRHLLLGSASLMLILGGCASSSSGRTAPARPPSAPPTTKRDSGDLLALYSRAEVPEVAVPPSRRRDTRRAEAGGGELASLLNRNAASLRTCYRLARAGRGAALEPLRLQIELETARRRVRSVQITGTRDGRLERCLTREIKRWRLPGRLPRTVSLPLLFHGS